MAGDVEGSENCGVPCTLDLLVAVEIGRGHHIDLLDPGKSQSVTYRLHRDDGHDRDLDQHIEPNQSPTEMEDRTDHLASFLHYHEDLEVLLTLWC